MTPKEKAKKIYSDMEDSITGLEGDEWYKSAKQCALIAVDLVLSETRPDLGFIFWQEVKQEIEKL